MSAACTTNISKPKKGPLIDFLCIIFKILKELSQCFEISKGIDNTLFISNEYRTPKGKKGSVSIENYVWQVFLENI